MAWPESVVVTTHVHLRLEEAKAILRMGDAEITVST